MVFKEIDSSRTIKRKSWRNISIINLDRIVYIWLVALQNFVSVSKTMDVSSSNFCPENIKKDYQRFLNCQLLLSQIYFPLTFSSIKVWPKAEFCLIVLHFSWKFYTWARATKLVHMQSHCILTDMTFMPRWPFHVLCRLSSGWLRRLVVK